MGIPALPRPSEARTLGDRAEISSYQHKETSGALQISPDSPGAAQSGNHLRNGQHSSGSVHQPPGFLQVGSTVVPLRDDFLRGPQPVSTFVGPICSRGRESLGGCSVPIPTHIRGMAATPRHFQISDLPLGHSSGGPFCFSLHS